MKYPCRYCGRVYDTCESYLRCRGCSADLKPSMMDAEDATHRPCVGDAWDLLGVRVEVSVVTPSITCAVSRNGIATATAYFYDEADFLRYMASATLVRRGGKS